MAGNAVAIQDAPAIPTKPSMTDSLRRLLTLAREKGVRNLPTIGPITRQEARDYLEAMEPLMKPADTQRTMARIAVLMAHYWTPQMPENLQKAVAVDWGHALNELPWNVVDATAREWVKTRERRPTPAAFLKLSEQFIKQDADDCQLLRYILRQDWDKAGQK